MRKLFFIPLLATLMLSLNVLSQNIPHMTQIDKQELRYMDNSVISILAWQEYMFYTKEKHGENSKEYISTIPNIEEFNKHYEGKFSIIKQKESYSFKPEKEYIRERDNYAIVGLTKEQKEDYCKFRTEVFNFKVSKKQKIVFSLPTAKDYEKALRFKSIKAVKEDNDISFRCVASIVK